MSDCIMCGKIAIEKSDDGKPLCVGCNNTNNAIIRSKNGRYEKEM